MIRWFLLVLGLVVFRSLAACQSTPSPSEEIGSEGSDVPREKAPKEITTSQEGLPPESEGQEKGSVDASSEVRREAETSGESLAEKAGGEGGAKESVGSEEQRPDATPEITPETPTSTLPPAGNPQGTCAIPAEARPEDTSKPTTVVGNGTPQSCTSAAFVSAVAKGGIITFNCGPAPATITLTETAKIFNNKGPKIVIDGGGKVTLSGGGKHRILYQNTCDQKQVWTTAHCQNQDHPQLTVQGLTFVEGQAKGLDPDGGGAIFVRGGRLKIIKSRFFKNTCDDLGPDVGGAAVRVLSQYNDLPVFVVDSTFGGRQDLGGYGSNGGGLSSIGVSISVINSLFSHNQAIGRGANPARPGTAGGGSGGAIYMDGNTFTLTLCGVRMAHNSANEGGGAIFFVSNDRTGRLIIKDSFLEQNPSRGFETKGYPGIFVLAKDPPEVTGSTIR